MPMLQPIRKSEPPDGREAAVDRERERAERKQRRERGEHDGRTGRLHHGTDVSEAPRVPGDEMDTVIDSDPDDHRQDADVHEVDPESEDTPHERQDKRPEQDRNDRADRE